MIGTKHLIQCHCVLPQYRKLDEPIFHKFVVYSKIEPDTGEIASKLSRCNNCDALHRVTDFCKSEIVLKLEDTDVVVDIDEIKFNLPERLVKILEKNNCDHATFESIDHIFEESAWDSNVVISRQTMEDGIVHVKMLTIKSEDKFRIKSEKINLSPAGEI